MKISSKLQKSKSQGNILIMDDEKDILIMLGRLLEIKGYKTATAKNGKEAVELYKNALQTPTPFHLVILDLTIPGEMGGIETLAKLMEIDQNVKAVVSSGYSNDPVMANYKEYGFIGSMPKPYTQEDINTVLNRVF